MSAIDPDIIVSDDHIRVVFHLTLNLNTINNAAFQLWTNSATPIQIFDPFQQVNVLTDYDTVRRSLTLWYRVTPNVESPYELRLAPSLSNPSISLLRDVAGRAIPCRVWDFVTGTATGYTIVPPDPEPIPIHDRSIIPAPFITTNTITAPNPDFYVVATDPSSEQVLINDNDYNGGRVTIKFSNYPADRYLNPAYFKVQRKLITRNVALWELVTGITISKDPVQPWVYLDFSLTTDPVPVYFSSQYRYRIKISKDIGVS